uniref:Reverse transcriptase domain-containing protein n=1 Tax=Tanacetum cinerariifolium TaxID=118510 RepID=A0A6L2MDZ3_TANCI|nr:reverse transcriptase domain-containing protein [Tanacetum cinerariifolium]
MLTRSSSNLVSESSPNLTSSNPNHRNRRHSKKPFSLKESPVDTMADQRTMAELLRAPTEGYAEASVVPRILPEHVELKHNLINMMTSDQFFRLEKDNPHDHIRWFNKITSIIKYKDVPNSGNSSNRPPGVANQIRPSGFAQPNVKNNQNQFSQPQGYNRGNNFNQDSSYQAPIQHNQVVPLSELEKIKKMNEINMKAMQTKINNVKNELRNEMKTSIQASMSNQTNELKNMMASFFQMNTASTSGSGPLPSNTISKLKEEDEPVEETLMDPELRRPFLRTARALIDVHEDEMILCDGDERLTLNMRHDISSYSNQPQKIINMINIYDDSCEDYLKDLFATNHLSGNPTFSSHSDLTSPIVKDDIFDPEGDIVLIEKLLNLDSIKDLPPPHNINPLSSSTTSSSNHLLEEFIDELALITFPPGNDDLPFDIESDLRELEYFLNHDHTKEMDYILEDSVDECNLADPKNNLVVTIPEMFIDKHTLDYSSPPLYDDCDDDLFELESNTDDVYNDPFDSKEDKIKESKLLIDEVDPPRSSDFLRILIHENLSEITVQATPDKNVKKISISHASLILEDFDPPLYKLPFQKEVPWSETLLSFSSKNKEKVFKPRILTSKGVYTSLLLELSHRGPKVFKVIKIFEIPMEIFLYFYGEDIRIVDVLCLHFYPP